MSLSRSMQDVTSQFLANYPISEFSSSDKKFILDQFKKLYSQQMGKAGAQLSRRKLVKSNKTSIQRNQQKQIKCIQQSITKRMQQHSQKRGQLFAKKNDHLKLVEEGWKLRMQEIKRKQKQQCRQSFQKATLYRKQSQAFWSQNNNKQHKKTKTESAVPVSQKAEFFTIKTQAGNNRKLNFEGKQFYGDKQKSQSMNQAQTYDNQALFPDIKSKKHYLNNGTHFQTKITTQQYQLKAPVHQSMHKLVDGGLIQEHFWKSKSLLQTKEQFVIQKAFKKLKKIQFTRKKCRENIQKSVKQAKIRREIRQDATLRASKHQQQQNQRIKLKKMQASRKLKQQAKNGIQKNKFRSPASLDKSILMRRQAKQQLEQQEFQDRNQLQIANIMKTKKGKIMLKVKQTINRLKIQVLRDSL